MVIHYSSQTLCTSIAEPWDFTRNKTLLIQYPECIYDESKQPTQGDM
jgi:hypothetical protein